MKLNIKRKNWNALRVESVKIYDCPDCDLVEGERVVVYEREGESLQKKGIFKKKTVRVLKNEIIFAYTPVKIGSDFVVLKTEGLAGGYWKTRLDTPTPQEVELKVGQTLEFQTPTMDSGIDFIVTLEK